MAARKKWCRPCVEVAIPQSIPVFKADTLRRMPDYPGTRDSSLDSFVVARTLFNASDSSLGDPLVRGDTIVFGNSDKGYVVARDTPAAREHLDCARSLYGHNHFILGEMISKEGYVGFSYESTKR